MGLFTDQSDLFPYPFIYFNYSEIPILSYCRSLSLSLQAIIGITPLLGAEVGTIKNTYFFPYPYVVLFLFGLTVVCKLRYGLVEQKQGKAV